MSNALSVKSKLVLILLIVGLLSTLVTGFLGWRNSRNTLQTNIFNQLISLRTAKAEQLQAYFTTMRRQVEILSEDDMIVQGMVSLNKSFRTLQTQTISQEMDNALESYYVNQFFPKLFAVLPGQADYTLYRPENQAGLYLQSHYIANNPHSNDLEKLLFDRAEDGSAYSDVHGYYHPRLRNIVQKFGYDDLLLVNAETGDVIYSVAKQVDFASNLDLGPMRKSNLVTLLANLRLNAERGSAQLVDFELYRPAWGQPAAFWGAPIYNGIHLIGILIVQISLNEVNNVMTYDQKWAQAGLGATGETYLVGRDRLMRSNSRFLLEDKEGLLSTLERQSASQQTRDLIDKLDTTILIQSIDSVSGHEVAQGRTGSLITPGYRGESVVSAYQPLFLEGLRWGVIAEMDQAEAFAPIYAFQNQLLISTVLMTLLCGFLALIIASYFMRPLQSIIHNLRKMAQGDYTTTEMATSNDEWGELATAFNGMAQDIRQQAQQLAHKSQENDRLLLNLLPSTLARRVQKGETNLVEQAQQVTVLAAMIHGGQGLISQKSAQAIAEILQEFNSDLDESAARYDVETLHTAGQQWIGLCGFSVARLDHSRRVIDFALLAQQSLQRLNRKHSINLELRIGVHAGLTHASVSSGKKLFYEMWGDTISLTKALVAEAPANTILTSQEIYDRLREQYTFRRGAKTAAATSWIVEGVTANGKVTSEQAVTSAARVGVRL